jgi:hypothetical protein
MKKLGVIALAILALASWAYGQREQADKNALKETLVNLEKQSWVFWKGHDGKFFQDFDQIVIWAHHAHIGTDGVRHQRSIPASCDGLLLGNLCHDLRARGVIT